MADSDANLTDHEWRLKMAAEGKALYIPGNTAEEMKAEMEERKMHEAVLEQRSIRLTKAEWVALDTAIPDIIGTMRDIKNVFVDLSYMEDLNQFNVTAMMRPRQPHVRQHGPGRHHRGLRPQRRRSAG